MHEYVGSIHLHSIYSDGGGTVREITAAARRAGLDYVVLTDHDTLRPRDDGWQGWRDGVLLVVGVEVTCRGRSHVLALNARNVAGLRWKPLRRVLFDLENQGAAAFIAHPHPADIMGISLKAGELVDWDVPGFSGLELWTFMHDICDRLTPWRMPSFLYTWPRYVRGPNPETLAHWDRMIRDRRFPVVGALDNHALAIPFLGKRFLSYEEGFRTLRTHVLAEELAGTRRDADLIVRAILGGRAFLALDLWADARGFRFEGETEGEAVLMGDERLLRGPVMLRALSPVPADLVILRDGLPAAKASGTVLEFRVDGPGVYRAEARLGGKPWVYTNPIYLRSG